MNITNRKKGVCLLAIGIIMRDTGCNAAEVVNAYKDRYAKLIVKKGKSIEISMDDALVLADLPLVELGE